jgi:hypothetical protein
LGGGDSLRCSSAWIQAHWIMIFQGLNFPAIMRQKIVTQYYAIRIWACDPQVKRENIFLADRQHMFPRFRRHTSSLNTESGEKTDSNVWEHSPERTNSSWAEIMTKWNEFYYCHYHHHQQQHHGLYFWYTVPATFLLDVYSVLRFISVGQRQDSYWCSIRAKKTNHVENYITKSYEE